MNKATSIFDIKERHYELYNESLADRATLLTNPDRCESFVCRVKELLKDIEEVSAEISSTADYVWLSNAVEQWQLAYASLNVSTDLELPKPVLQLQPSLSPSVKLLSDEEVSQWIADKAYHIGKDRKEKLLRKLQENPEILQKIVAQPNRLLEILGCEPEHIESKKDWCLANVHFACYVLDGYLNLCHQLSPRSYWRLEQQWLEEVKQLKAYFIWENRGDSVNEEYAVDDYCQASSEIEKASFNSDTTQNYFKEVAEYIKQQYLTSEMKVDMEKCYGLIERKAYHLFDVTKNEDRDRNWQRAEKYVQLFYGNIIPAVRGDSATNIKNIKEVVRYHPEYVNHLLVNCFEMALVTYFT